MKRHFTVDLNEPNVDSQWFDIVSDPEVLNRASKLSSEIYEDIVSSTKDAPLPAR